MPIRQFARICAREMGSGVDCRDNEIVHPGEPRSRGSHRLRGVDGRRQAEAPSLWPFATTKTRKRSFEKLNTPAKSDDSKSAGLEDWPSDLRAPGAGIG